MKKVFKKINSCRICNDKNLINIIDLKKQYIQGSFEKENHPQTLKTKIPLQLVICKKCSLVQTKHTVSPDALYENYWYKSGVNFTMTDHLLKLAKESKKILKNKNKKIKILDIGCNDGTLLRSFPKTFIKVGIDPSQIAKKLKSENLTIINDFFPSKNILLKYKNNKFDLITSIAMFYDIQDPTSFVNNIKNILNENGIWIFELSYLVDMLKLNSYDTICHEHLEYYSITALNYLMKKTDMKIFKIQFNEINGGSIRCYVTHSSNQNYDNKNNLNVIKKTLKKEANLKINTTIPYKKFFKRIIKIKHELNELIRNIKKNKKIVHIYGASTKGNTIIQWQGINDKIIEFAADRNPQKWGAKTIGSNIKIISEEKSKKMSPDYYLVLPWHFKKEFLKREKFFMNNGGKMIFPLPKIKIY
tara:strand:- start:2668 stop:3918 length:1251 start_codon:yes stop_codon:yes gene_type:complete